METCPIHFMPKSMKVRYKAVKRDNKLMADVEEKVDMNDFPYKVIDTFVGEFGYLICLTASLGAARLIATGLNLIDND